MPRAPRYTYLLFLHVEVVDDHTNEEVEREEGAEDDEEDKIHVHPGVSLYSWLLANLQRIIHCVYKVCKLLMEPNFDPYIK